MECIVIVECSHGEIIWVYFFFHFASLCSDFWLLVSSKKVYFFFILHLCVVISGF